MAKHLAAKTREEHKKLKLEERSRTGADIIPSAKPRTPFWLRFVLFLAAIFLSVTAGALTGYSGLGHGNPIDVFKLSTWTHIYDLVEKK